MDSKEYKRETYYFFKSLGICVDCRKYTAVPGKISCEVCALKHSERSRRRWENLSEEEKQEQRRKEGECIKKLKDERKRKKLCVSCGRPQTKNSIYCYECRLKDRRRKARKRALERMDKIPRSKLPVHGICYRCTKNQVMEGRHLCAECYEQNLKALEIARNSKKLAEHVEYLKRRDRLHFMKKSV